nr:prominin-1-A-like [Lytechinus pictus]
MTILFCLLTTDINGTLFYMEAIDTRQARMEIDYEILSTNLTNILSDLTTLCGSCSCCTAATTELRNVQIDADYRDINVTESIGSFPQVLVSQSIVELTDVANRNISDQAQEGYQTFEDIPDTLTNTTSSEVGDIITTIDGLEDTLNQFINETTFTLQSTSGSIEPFEEQANNILSTYANDYDQYRAIVMYVFYGFILFIVVLFLLGLLIGIFSYDRNASPTDRGSCSNCGGLFLMAGAGFVFIFGTLMMLITALTFIIGGPIDRLMCDPLVSGQLFAQTVDLEDGILDDGYYLGNLIFSDPSVPFQISGFLDACEQNEAVYTAFLLENLFNVTEFTDISSQIPDVDDQFSNITGDFSSVEILTSDTKDTLIDFRDSPADTIDWTIFTNELDTSLLYDGDGNNDTLVELISALGTDAGAASGSNANNLNAIKDDLQTLQDEIVDVLLSDAVLIAGEIDSLTAYTDDIDVSLYKLINTIIGDPSSIDLSLLTDNITRYQQNLMGFAICFVLGLLFVLIFPIVALCFCCCRCCCKNCGGKMHMDQKDNSCCRVMIYSICLLASLVFVFSGAVTALCISGYTGSQATTLPTRVSDNILDFVRYLNNTLEEIDFVMTDQLSFTLDQVRTDLNDIGTIVGVPVRESLRTNVGPAIDAVIDMEESKYI